MEKMGKITWNFRCRCFTC